MPRDAAAVQARIARFAAAVRAALERLGFTIFSQPGAHSPTVVAAYPPPGIDARALLDRLRLRHGVVLAGGREELSGKIVRFGTMGDVCEVDLLGAVAAIELELVASGVAADAGRGQCQRAGSAGRASYKWCRLRYGIANGRANHGIVESIASSSGESYATRYGAKRDW